MDTVLRRVKLIVIGPSGDLTLARYIWAATWDDLLDQIESMVDVPEPSGKWRAEKTDSVGDLAIIREC